MSNKRIRERVADYYSSKIRHHGPTPAGVDWRDRESQETRFEGLLKIIDRPATSLIEIGCGYGALYEYLAARGHALSYFGYDISEEMIATAKRIHSDATAAQFHLGDRPRVCADYCVASGIFNVKFDIANSEWLDYLFETTDLMAAAAQHGFAFNCLTAHSDREHQEARLYYSDPGVMLNNCICRYGRRVSLIHGNPPYEFTVLVRHNGPK